MPMMVGSRSKGRDYSTRFVVLGGAFLLAAVILVGRLYSLQITRGEEYNAKSIDNFVKETRIQADRGMVLDNRGRILVDNRPSYNVTLTPAFCQPSGMPRGYCLDEVLPKLATYLTLEQDEVARITRQVKEARGLKRFKDFTVKIDVDLDALDRIEANKLELFGVDVVPVPHRNYRYGALASHLLGYMNEISGEELDALEAKGVTDYQLGDYVGRRGLERTFEKELRGKDGAEKTVVDAKGRKLRDSDNLLKNVERVTPPKSGNNLVLSLSLPLQQMAERAFPGTAGAVVVVDVNTGFILAMTSKPAVDPNKLTGRISRDELRSISQDPLEPLIFRAIQQHYAPGSTWKLVTGIAALEAGAMTRSGAISCGGGYTLGKRRWRCHKESGHGLVDLHHAISWSCDTWFYTAADRMGLDPISDMAKALGFGRLTGVDLGPEAPGIVPSVEYHNKVTPGGYTKGLALNTAIGQGDVNVTPLQLVMAYAALANGGTVYKPQLVRRIEDGEGHLVKSMEPVVMGKVPMKPETQAAMVEGFKATVNEPGGTAYYKRLKDIEVAGKTGTAQVVVIGEGRRLKKEEMDYFERDHAWFAGFAPADKPEIAVVVLNEHGGHGGSDSAPTAMEVIKEYFRLKAEEEAARTGAPLEPAPAAPPPSAPASPMPPKPPPPVGEKPA